MFAFSNSFAIFAAMQLLDTADALACHIVQINTNYYPDEGVPAKMTGDNIPCLATALDARQQLNFVGTSESPSDQKTLAVEGGSKINMFYTVKHRFGGWAPPTSLGAFEINNDTKIDCKMQDREVVQNGDIEPCTVTAADFSLMENPPCHFVRIEAAACQEAVLTIEYRRCVSNRPHSYTDAVRPGQQIWRFIGVQGDTVKVSYTLAGQTTPSESTPFLLSRRDAKITCKIADPTDPIGCTIS